MSVLCVAHGVGAQTALRYASPGDRSPHTFAAGDRVFLLDGKPLQIVAGEMDYARMPREAWPARLAMARAMGLNAVTTPVFWNWHASAPGAYDFSGEKDIAEFVREAQAAGLYVVVKAGPWVGDEWTMGGLPSWLLEGPEKALAWSDGAYAEAASAWLKRLGQELAPLQVGNGGPILMVQLESEFGRPGASPAGVVRNRDALLAAGFDKSLLYTGDAGGEISAATLPELPVAIAIGDNGPTAEQAFAAMEKLRPHDPGFASSMAVSVRAVWGTAAPQANAAGEVANLEWILRQGKSVSLHELCGGTNFGASAGALGSSDPRGYWAFLTSRDGQAPLDERGAPTAMYFELRGVIVRATGAALPKVPTVEAAMAVPAFKFAEALPLWSALPKPVESDHPLTMEELGQTEGYVLYRTRYPAQAKTWDTGEETIHDYAVLFVNGIAEARPRTDALVGTGDVRAYDRRTGNDVIRQQGSGRPVRRRNDGSREEDADTGTDYILDFLVEDSGRLSDGAGMLADHKGIVAYAAPAMPLRWENYSVPMSDVSSLHFKQTWCIGPCFYRTKVQIEHAGDTFFDMRHFSRGQVWVNGHALGRYAKVGPQTALYVPGVWLRAGENEVVVFDVDGDGFGTIEGLAKPAMK